MGKDGEIRTERFFGPYVLENGVNQFLNDI